MESEQFEDDQKMAMMFANSIFDAVVIGSGELTEYEELAASIASISNQYNASVYEAIDICGYELDEFDPFHRGIIVAAEWISYSYSSS